VIGYHPYIQPYHQTQNQTQTTKLKNAGKKKINQQATNFQNATGYPFLHKYTQSPNAHTTNHNLVGWT
jgi:hypothetical protein